MKKSIWIILPIVIIAVVLVAVFAGQRNSLNDQLLTAETANQELTRQLTEADMAAKTAQELAENDIAAARQQVEEATAALTEMTTQRDALQAKSDAAAAQLNDSIRQAQIALDALIGEEASPEKELAAAKAELADTQAELEAVKAEAAAYQEAAAENKTLLETAQAEAAEAKAALEAAEADTAARIEAAVAAALAEVKAEKTAVTLTDGEGRTVAQLESLAELEGIQLEPGEYTLTLTVISPEGDETAVYAFPYAVTGPEAEEEAQEEAPAEEAAEEPAAQEAPAQEEETPQEEAQESNAA